MRKVEHPCEEFFLEGHPTGDRRRPGSSCEYHQKREDKHARQRMSLIDGRAWVFQFLKMDDDLIQRDTLRFRHDSSPSRHRFHGSHTGKGIHKTVSFRWACKREICCAEAGISAARVGGVGDARRMLSEAGKARFTHAADNGRASSEACVATKQNTGVCRSWAKSGSR
jgi:hypothetical protein